jgi:hypothetical protein
MTLTQLEQKGKRQLRLFRKAYETRVRNIKRAQRSHVKARLHAKTPNKAATVNSVVRSGAIYNLLYKPLLNRYNNKKL